MGLLVFRKTQNLFMLVLFYERQTISNVIVFDCYIRQASNIHTKQIHLFNITKIGGGLTERWRGAGAENGVKRKWRAGARAGAENGVKRKWRVGTGAR